MNTDLILIMRVLCINRYEKNLFGILIFSVLLSVQTIRLYVFDSPAALQNIFYHEMSLLDDLTDIYLKKHKALKCRTQNINHMKKRTRVQISYPHNRLQRKRSQKWYVLYENYYKQDECRKNHQKSSSLRTNFFSKDSDADVFNGAVDGLLMLQRVYDIDFSNHVTLSKDLKNASAISHKILSGRGLAYLDLILLSIRAITVVWYDNAIQILNIAAKYFQSDSPLKGNLPIFHYFSVPYLTSIAKSGILMQQNDPNFAISSRLLPFSTSRFDHGLFNSFR